MDTLDNLAGAVAAADAETTASLPADPNAPPAAPAAPDPQDVARDMVNGFAGLVTAHCPDAGEIWTEEARAASAAVLAPLAEKYNWSLERIPPEVTAAIVVGPLLWKTSVLVADQIRAKRRAASLPAPAPVPAQGAQPAPREDGAPPVAVHPQMALYRQ